jgi:hypothetical protein
MFPVRAVDEVKELVGRGVPIELTELNGQCYALAKEVTAPSPPWSRPAFDILIVIPAAYDAAELNGFYIELPHSYDGADHPRAKGEVIEHLGRKWRLVSWHYPDGKPWVRGRDTLETHVTHCRGFFSGRGAINAR